ncbi:e9imm peptide [Streptomyces sp. NPDC090052]|uniref:e9imm peptide n=1 Tax=Streptomyces sp. NPDC090052 TaxID=3365931 RepID=UPI0037FCDAB0
MSADLLRRMSHEDAVLAGRLMEADTATEAEADELLDALVRGLACPHVSDYIFWDFDPSLTAERDVERALAYRPIAL